MHGNTCPIYRRSSAENRAGKGDAHNRARHRWALPFAIRGCSIISKPLGDVSGDTGNATVKSQGSHWGLGSLNVQGFGLVGLGRALRVQDLFGCHPDLYPSLHSVPAANEADVRGNHRQLPAHIDTFIRAVNPNGSPVPLGQGLDDSSCCPRCRVRPAPAPP